MTQRYGFYTLTFLVIANMIGAGVFTTSGFALADLKSPWLVLLAWVIGGAIALSGAISYGLLARVMPESGGEYLFLSKAAHPLLGSIAGWVSLLAGFSGAIAAAALTMEMYLPQNWFNWGDRGGGLPTGTIAIITIIVAGLLHGLRPTWGALAQNVAVVLKLVLFAAILGFAGWQAEEFVRAGEDVSVAHAPSPVIWLLAGSLVWISFSFSGFNAAVYVASEVRNPERTIPRALLCGTMIVVGIYLGLNAVFVLFPPVEAVAGQKDIAAVAARFIGGPTFERFVRGTIALCLLTSVFSMMLAAPRVYARMAEDGVLPRWLRFQGEAPWQATVAQIVIASLLVLGSELKDLLWYLGLTLSLSAACSVSCLFLPAVRAQLVARKFSDRHVAEEGVVGDEAVQERLSAVWFVAPFFFVVCTLIIATMFAIQEPQQLIGTGLTFLVGTIAYLIVSQSHSRST